MKKLSETRGFKKVLEGIPLDVEVVSGAGNSATISHKCLKCWDLGDIDTTVETEAYGALAWLNAGIKPEEIIWCDCEMGAKAREMYTEEYESRKLTRYKRRLERQFELAGVPPRFQDTEIPRSWDWDDQLMKHKRRAYAACQMMIKEGFVVPSRLGEYDPQARIREGEKVVRPDHEYKSLALLGPKGVGKTAALSAVFRHYLGEGVAGYWAEWYNTVGAVQQAYSPNNEADPEELVQTIQQIPLALIDDLGDVSRTSRETDDRRRILWRILDYRHSRDLMTLVSSNLDERGLRDQFDNRVVDRLFEMGFMCLMGGKNLRQVEV